ncbi:IS3 family transposase [Enterococcus cecorum]|uniref:IS3 family transposase n=1 Tax=Enterococcus cecorum TaxID=44008 RepID=UPI000E0E94A7|nr:IS3 family transposase [Enterococcus cecorum]
MPKATYVLAKRFDRENPDKELEEKIQEIRKNNKDYGYRRIHGELHNQGYLINKKKVQRIVQNWLAVTSYTRKSRNSSYKAGLYIAPTEFADALIRTYPSKNHNGYD